MHKFLLAGSAALLLPALSACSYMPGWAGGSSSAYSSGVQSYDYNSAAYAEGSAYNSGSTYGDASYLNPATSSVNYSNASYASDCGTPTYVHASPCATVTTSSYLVPTSSELVAQGNLNCNNIGCSPRNTYSVYDNNHYPVAQKSALRGSYNSDYLYGNIGGVAYDVGEDNFGVIGRVGYQSKYYVGAEIEGSLGLNDDSTQTGATTLKAGTDYSVGAFALARLPLGKRFSVHARGGYHVTKLSASVDNGTTVVKGSDSFDGLAYGAGAEFNMSERNSLRVDYTRYDFDDNTLNTFNVGPTDSVSLAFARRF